MPLSGDCGSSTGCSCSVCWGLNSAVAEAKKNGIDCETKGGDIVYSKQKMAKLIKSNFQGYGSLEKFQERDAAGCKKFLDEVATLKKISPDCKPCNIIKNNHPNTTGSDRVLAPGPVDVIVEETVYKHINYDFSAVYPAPIIQTDLGKGPDNSITGESHSQQLAQVTFNKEDFENTSKGLEKKCTSIYWDPYGRVFDAVSLEPISYREITIIDELTGQPAVMTSSINYDITGEDGLFNILVEKEGNYRLKIGESTVHDFVTSPKLSPYWSKIYSDLYYPGKVFFEKTNVATHHDIPLQPKGQPYSYAISQFIFGSMKSQNLKTHIVYSGRNTFPMAKICLKEEETGKTIDHCVNADGIGMFTLAIPINKIPPKKLILVSEKVNLNNPALYQKNNVVQTIKDSSSYSRTNEKNEQYSFEPILSHVEGYVYGKNNQRIPKAEVLVKLSMNDQFIYQTKADDSGFFTIYTKDLPYLEYYLEFTDPVTQEKIIKTTSEFVSGNQSYLESEKINLMQGTKQDQEIINLKTGQLNNIIEKNNHSQENNRSAVPTKKSINLSLITIIVIILLLAIIIIGIVFYIKKARS